MSGRHPARAAATTRLALAGLLVALAACAACASRAPAPRPDVVLVTFDRLRWEELSPWGGAVAAPAFADLKERGVEWTGVVSPSPGGAPAALTVLTGLPPSGHGVRALADGRIHASAQSLADRLHAQGWAAGAFLQTDAVPVSIQADRAFEAWDAPPDGFPVAHPGTERRRPLQDVIGAGAHWLARVPQSQPGLLWIHLAEPALPEAEGADRASRLGDADRALGALVEAARGRGARRGIAPIVIICNLSSHGPDPAVADDEGYLLKAAALRVRVLAVADGLGPATVPALAGLDEVAPLAEALATDGDARLLALARGQAADPREAIVAETLLPLTSLGAEPLKAALPATGEASDASHPAVVASMASDTTWPGGSGRPDAASVLASFHALDVAWSLVRRGRGAEAVAAFQALADAGLAAPGVRTGLGLTLAASGRAPEALAQFEALRAEAKPGTLAWTQARLGVALAARATGAFEPARAALDEIVRASPGDVRALTWLAETAEMAGDRQGAVASLLALAEADPDNPFAQVELGRQLLAAGRPKDAARAFTVAVQRRPTNPALLLAAADVYAAAGDWWTALDRINDRIAVYGASPETDLAAARCWRDMERWELAGEYFGRVVAARPDDARATLGLAEAHFYMGREAEARAAWARARELAPGDPAPCAMLAQFLHAARRDVASGLAAAGCPGP